MNLLNLEKSTKAVIAKINGDQATKKDLLELGILPGSEVKLISKGFFKGPIAFTINGTTLALRRSEAEFVEVTLCV